MPLSRRQGVDADVDFDDGPRDQRWRLRRQTSRPQQRLSRLATRPRRPLTRPGAGMGTWGRGRVYHGCDPRTTILHRDPETSTRTSAAVCGPGAGLGDWQVPRVYETRVVGGLSLTTNWQLYNICCGWKGGGAFCILRRKCICMQLWSCTGSW